MNPLALVAVAVGGALGSLLRWWFSYSWNAVQPSLPLGTLASNLVGGYFDPCQAAWHDLVSFRAPDGVHAYGNGLCRESQRFPGMALVHYYRLHGRPDYVLVVFRRSRQHVEQRAVWSRLAAYLCASFRIVCPDRAGNRQFQSLRLSKSAQTG